MRASAILFTCVFLMLGCDKTNSGSDITCNQSNGLAGVATQRVLASAHTPEEVTSAMNQLDWGPIIDARSTGKCNEGVGEFVWDMQNLTTGQIQQKYGPDVASDVDRRLVKRSEEKWAEYHSR